MSGHVNFRVDGHVAEITLNRSDKLLRLNVDMLNVMAEHVQAVDRQLVDQSQHRRHTRMLGPGSIGAQSGGAFGKAGEVALVAVMRKLLLYLNAVARRGTPWLPQEKWQSEPSRA